MHGCTGTNEGHFDSFIASHLSRRLNRPPAAVCAKPANRPRKMRFCRQPAEKIFS